MLRSEEFTNKYQSLQECYLLALPEKLDSIDRHWSMLNNVNWSYDEFKRMHTCVHHLAGSAGGFGLMTLSKEAQKLDGIIFECLKSERVPDSSSKEKVSSSIKKLFKSAGVVNAPDLSQYSTIHRGKKILVIDDDHDQTPLIELLCTQLKCKVSSIHSLAKLKEQLAKEVPDLILMDIVFPEGQCAGIDTIEQLHSEVGFDIPVVFMSSRNDLSSRLKAYRAGGLGYLNKPFSGGELKLQLDLIDSHIRHYAKVLVIDKEENTQLQIAPSLKAKGFQCFYSNKPAVIIHMLERHSPDVLILDLDTPGVNGDEILQILRQEVKYINLPILVVTEKKDFLTSDNATAHGASGVIHKPVNMDTLTESIEALVSKTAVMNSVMDQVTLHSEDNHQLSSHLFYSLVDNCIHDNRESESRTVVLVSFRNHEELIAQIELTHIQEVNEKLLSQISQLLISNERIVNLSPFTYALLLSSKHAAPLEKRLQDVKKACDSVSLKINKSFISFDCCTTALYLHSGLESVDQVFNSLNESMFTLLSEDTGFLKIANNIQRLSSLSEEEVEAAIEYSMENNTLLLSYQPIIDINGDEKIFEGLARIKDSQDSTLMPNVFLHGLRDDKQKELFNRGLVQRAVSDMAQLKGLAAEEVEIIVKICILEKSPTPFLSMVSNILRASRIRGKNRLIFSISEEDAVLHPNKIKELHKGVRDLNCSFLLDHAGASNHTQSILNNGHFEYAKLSLKTIKNIKLGKAQDVEFVQSLLSRDMIVIAPYIEDNVAFSTLWKLGVRYFQGYFLRKPESTLQFDFKIEHINH